MAYGTTETGQNNAVIDMQARYGVDSSTGTGLVLGTDATEGNTVITDQTDTIFLGNVAPVAGVGYMNFKTAPGPAEVIFAEAGFLDSNVLDKRYALDTPLTIPIGFIAAIQATVTGATT